MDFSAADAITAASKSATYIAAAISTNTKPNNVTDEDISFIPKPPKVNRETNIIKNLSIGLLVVGLLTALKR